MDTAKNIKSARNKTIILSEDDIKKYSPRLKSLSNFDEFKQENQIYNSTCEDLTRKLENKSIDLLFLDPPYNLTKKFSSKTFKETDIESYSVWFEEWFKEMVPKLKDTGSIYVCGDWKTSISIYSVLSKYTIIRNRITWEREKGRGAKKNYKNSDEDIWFATMSNDYIFNVDDIKLKRKVLAPYKKDGEPKDWQNEKDGNFRLTYPSNIWTDISIPFWSMSENTEHPTQKPEKLLAKLILASTNENDLVFDPFLGSGTTAVVAKKLNRKYLGAEISEKYAMLALKRLDFAEKNKTIQGYSGGVFWERNSIGEQHKYGK